MFCNGKLFPLVSESRRIRDCGRVCLRGPVDKCPRYRLTGRGEPIRQASLDSSSLSGAQGY